MGLLLVHRPAASATDGMFERRRKLLPLRLLIDSAPAGVWWFGRIEVS